ncbi:hypothetical protein [Halostreptopolyspora alba]|uniref:Uncharacterized protein n=1 Tax=Halostreptopolyspora alba TaxID=2487137 RepID=A0A3N0EAI3_9ACTN|nr:hypothetical protein EFW17_10685 [Nocardiopsaceae bacterium YIM 96095]
MTAETKTAPAKAETPCTCSKYADATTGETTGCTKTTRRDFAPGHDAKLKGFLIRAGAAGHLVALAGAPDEPVQASEAASRFGFARHVASGISRAQAKQEQATADADTVRAKVGRWERTGHVEGDTFTYTDRSGAARTTTKFTLL